MSAHYLPVPSILWSSSEGYILWPPKFGTMKGFVGGQELSKDSTYKPCPWEGNHAWFTSSIPRHGSTSPSRLFLSSSSFRASMLLPSSRISVTTRRQGNDHELAPRRCYTAGIEKNLNHGYALVTGRRIGNGRIV